MMPAGSEQETRVDRIIREVKNHPVLAFFFLLATVVIGIGEFTGALREIAETLKWLVHTQPVTSDGPTPGDPAGPNAGSLLRDQPGDKGRRDASGKGKADEQLTVGRYLNTAIRNRAESREFAILILDENGQFSLAIEQAIADVLAQDGVVPIQSFFAPVFIEEGRARALFDGEWRIAHELDLKARIDNLILGRARVSYSATAQYTGLWTANVTLELKCFDFDHQTMCGSRTINVPGAGYTQAVALENAVKGMQPQLKLFVQAFPRTR